MSQATSQNPGDSRLLLRRAVWCGTVSALAVLLTFLNIFPPFDVRYEVRTEVVVSADRLAQLQQHVDSGAAGATEPARGNTMVRLTDVHVLDLADTALVNATEQDELMLVEVHTEWSKRYSDSEHRQWLEQLTSGSDVGAGDSDTERQLRLAEWEQAAAEHYLARHDFLSRPGPKRANSDGRTFQLAAGPSRPQAQLAGHVSSSESNPADVRNELEERLHLASQWTRETEVAFRDRVEQSSGMIRLAGQPDIETDSGSIPVWIVFSIVVLGLSTGSVCGWAQWKLQSGGAYLPSRVAEQLALEGIPVAGEVVIPDDQIDRQDWVGLASTRAGEASRRTGRNLIWLAEVWLGLWIVLIGARLLTDPMWRGLLWDSPLAAFGRTLIGLP